MALVQLTISALPAHVRTARLMATAVARRAGIAESALDEIRLAVGEACSRAVEAHRVHCPSRPIQLDLIDSAGSRAPEGPPGRRPRPASQNGRNAQRFEVVVFDRAPAKEPAEAFDDQPGLGVDVEDDSPATEIAGLSPDVGLAVIVGLADEVSIEPHEDGTVVRMSWPLGKTDPETGSQLVG
ncbi:ATP-binding protein [Streptomonospora sp. PA3]|uniref:ATP-binding protein n=1 Tax=Streptomonospora sp. PA3 TaxID=2607326 RepID=UPI0012DE62D3|nr:ATP-binding protein [Streptomonospora sp. PA3]MUL44119.1 ATP-binding protein [Streptomonospora sp. PA3]